eukprot:Sspe_Gene.54926::Locus_30257_Transcript_1_1_Confidence_1.000_Length_1960::g.54926::m.54926
MRVEGSATEGDCGPPSECTPHDDRVAPAEPLVDDLGFAVRDAAAYTAWRGSRLYMETRKAIETEVGSWGQYILEVSCLETLRADSRHYYPSIRWMSKQRTRLERQCPRVLSSHAEIEAAHKNSASWSGHRQGLKLRATCVRILSAYALRNRAVGYHQGFTPICRVLAATMPEEDAFWVLALFAEKSFHEYYSGVYATMVDVAILEWMIQTLDPDLAQHLDELDVNLTVVVYDTLFSLLSLHLPPTTTIILWRHILRTRFPRNKLLRFITSFFTISRAEFLAATDALSVKKLLEGKLTTLYDPTEVIAKAKASEEYLHDITIQRQREQFSRAMARDSALLQSQRDAFDLTCNTLFTPQLLVQMRCWWGRGLNEHITQRQFVALMEKLNINSAEHNLLAVFRQWDTEGNSRVTFRELLLGLIMLLDVSVEEKLMTVMEILQPDATVSEKHMSCSSASSCSSSSSVSGSSNTITYQSFKDFLVSPVWDAELQALNWSSGSFGHNLDSSQHLTVGPPKKRPRKHQGVFALLDTDHDGQLDFKEFSCAVLAIPNMGLLLGAVREKIARASIWTVDKNKPTWVPDNCMRNCFVCKRRFRWYRRKHHCRACGQIICDSCSSTRLPITVMGYEEPVRVCHAC